MKIKACKYCKGPLNKEGDYDGCREFHLIGERDYLQDRVKELEVEVDRMENLLAEGIHTCNPTCKRPMCVLRRENRKLREAARVVLEGRRGEEGYCDKVPHHRLNALQAALLEGGGDE